MRYLLFQLASILQVLLRSYYIPIDTRFSKIWGKPSAKNKKTPLLQTPPQKLLNIATDYAQVESILPVSLQLSSTDNHFARKTSIIDFEAVL